MDSRFRTVLAIVNAEMAQPYVMPTADCFILACRVADALDPSAGMEARYCGGYSTPAGAYRHLHRRLGFTDLSALFEARLERISPASARLGDLAVARLADGAEHAFVCLGARFVTKVPHGRAYVDLGGVIAAFRTGR